MNQEIVIPTNTFKEKKLSETLPLKYFWLTLVLASFLIWLSERIYVYVNRDRIIQWDAHNVDGLISEIVSILIISIVISIFTHFKFKKALISVFLLSLLYFLYQFLAFSYYGNNEDLGMFMIFGIPIYLVQVGVLLFLSYILRVCYNKFGFWGYLLSFLLFFIILLYFKLS